MLQDTQGKPKVQARCWCHSGTSLLPLRSADLRWCPILTKKLLHREKPFLQTHVYTVHMLFHGYTKQSRCWANCCWSTRKSLSTSWLSWRTNGWSPCTMWEILMLCLRSSTGVVYNNNAQYYSELSRWSAWLKSTHMMIAMPQLENRLKERMKVK